MKIGIVLRKYRIVMELDLRSLSKEIGISAASLMRIEHGREFDALTFKKILNWLLSK